MIMGFYFASVLKKFLRETPRIESTADLDSLREIVKVQMYAALSMIVILGIPIVVYIIGIFNRTLYLGDFVYPVVVNTVAIVVGKSNRKIERRVQSLQCTDPDLKMEYDSIVYTWEKKALPNW
jgi:hypothetical protein